MPYSVIGCCEVVLAEKLSSMSCVSRVTWSTVDLPCRKMIDTSVDESLEDFKRDTQQRYGTVALWVPQWLFWLRDRNY